MHRSARSRTRTASVVAAACGSLLLASLMAVPQAAAEHTPLPTSVTLAGSLQSELGCPGDWQPACEASTLAPTSTPSVFSTDFSLLAGAYEFKVTIDGSWAENYGAGGVEDGPNIPLVLAGPAQLTVTYDHTTHLVAVTPPALPTEVTDDDRANAGTSLRAGLTKERFYFVMTDRFDNGDPANDDGGLGSDRLVSGLDPTDKGFYHGGDLRGLIDRLDYIQGMGTTAIWLTPSFKNNPVQGAGANVSAGYHGYWITDFTQIDPHLGTNAELSQLIDQAHSKGMKVFFDIITNHTADVIDYTQGQYTYIPKADKPYQDAAGNVFDDKQFAAGNTFPTIDPDTSFPYTPYFRTPADETVKVPEWLNNRTYYHNRGNAAFDGTEGDEYGDFVGLDDLWTEQPVVRDQLIEMYKFWAAFGIDGFRIDTVKHVNMEFWQKFAPNMLETAEAAGKHDFFMFGEVFDADPAKTSRFTTEGGLQATLDFGFQARASGFGNGRPTTELRELFAGDDYYTDADSNAYSLPTFLGNHDMGRIGRFLSGSGATGDELLQRDKMVQSLMYLTRGQPVTYYGDEQGFVGDGGDKDARQDMFPSQVASYNDDDLIGTDSTTAEANFETEHPIYEHLDDLSRLRDENPTLADGAQIHRYSSNAAGVYAFSRINADDRIEYVVAVNNAEEEETVTFDTFSEGMKFKGLWSSDGSHVDTVDSDGEGRLTVSVPPLTALVWRAKDAAATPDAAPEVSFRTPVAGGTVGGRAEIGAIVPGNRFAQTTFLWREVGTDDWKPLGTDDNAPYRVFHDVSDLAKGTLVEYRAIAADGKLGVASTYATVGDPPPPVDAGGGDDPASQPGFVSIPGDLNSEMGCPGDWQPDCAQAQLTLDEADGVWKGTFNLPAGSYQYKVAIDKAWTENYGKGAVRDGANIVITTTGAPVTFYYDHGTHWVTSSAEPPIVTAPGSFQLELGCQTGDWQPACMLPWLKDLDGDGVFTYRTTKIPAGSYAVKVTHGLSWAENYGQGGVPNGADITFSVPADGVLVTFSYDLGTHVLTVTTSRAGPAPDLTKQKAHWLTSDLVAFDLPADTRGWTFRLHWAEEGGLVVDDEAVLGGDSAPLELVPGGLPAELQAQYPHLAAYEALRLPDSVADISDGIVQGQVAVAAYDDLGRLADATGLQIPGVLDDLYDDAYDRDLGVTWRGGNTNLALWAPTAKDVHLLVRRPGAAADTRVPMRRDDDGVWMASGGEAWKGASYLYEVKVYVPATGKVETNLVTDPYSLALTTDSARSVMVDLADSALEPTGWDELDKPAFAQPEDTTIYELHARDFSISDETVPAEHRGTYLAFTDTGSDGMQHLASLAEAGMTHLHLLPVFDIATIPEVRSEQQTPDCDLEALSAADPAGEQQQACVGAVTAKDGFNWGYDPWHYTTPEGSYATNPEGPQRTREFREMVQGINGAGLRVVMDVVYNHTTTSGQAEKSVLDQVVPGYYHRLSLAGALETSTCCANTATEHRMMEKLMVDSVVTWAKDYKVDGFRFDLMGHHSKANMLAVRAALDSLTLSEDGVDGEDIYVYGEGWNFGEVADNARFVQATQANMAGTGIGTFTDRLRDAVRGGGPFDANPGIQGFGSGLVTDPNVSGANGSPEEQRARILLYHDQIKVGLAGNLADYSFVDRSGATVTGKDVLYNGQPAGYAADPSETVTYVDAHDNETLFDALQYKLPVGTTMADRGRMNTLSLSTTALSQGVSFWHAGADILRSKSLDRNSYDSGDWFNRVDWSYQDSTWGSGLPPQGDNASKRVYAEPLLGNPALEPAPADIAATHAAALELLKIRFSSPLFRLGDAGLIQQRVGFPTGGPSQTPGVVVMTLDDRSGTDLDPGLERIVVVWNATPQSQVAQVDAAATLSLHPVQAEGSDEVVKQTTTSDSGVTVPARTVAVLVQG